MNDPLRTSSAGGSLLAMVVVLALVAVAAQAAEPTAASDSPVLVKRAQSDKADCSKLPVHGERANCLSEASTRLAATRPVRPDADPGRYTRNALMRCEPLPEPDRADCVARIEGEGTTSGSVGSGGISRELVTPAPALAPPASQ